MSKVLSRAAKIARVVEKGIAGLSPADLLAPALLPALRASAAKALGGSPAIFYGTVDPLYYRAVGLAYPLPVEADAATTKAGDPSAALRKALARRRAEGGRLARYDVLRASVEATIGRRVSDTEVKALLDRAGLDREESYTGRGTRVAAPKTYADASVATDAASE